MKLMKLSFGTVCILSLYMQATTWTDEYIVPKWLFTLLAIGAVGICYALSLLANKRSSIKTIDIAVIVTAICTLLSVHGIAQLVSSPNTPITGCFDNSAGYAGCLCAGIPFCLYFCQKGNRYGSIIGFGLFFLGFIAVCLSLSRAGITSLVSILIIYLCKHQYHKSLQKKSNIAIIAFFLFLFLSGMYFIKKNSADGRILIWKTALEMIKVHPIAGHGNNAIAAHYMDYQADYFEKHPDSPYILLGDNVKHLFNEYLEVGVRYGIVGWLLLLSTAWFMLHCYKKAQVYKQGIAFYSLGSISIFACFSYPLTYPFVWIILITDVILLVRGAYPQSFPHSYRKLGSSITGATILILSSVLLYKTATRIEAESQWGKISDISQRGNTEAMRPNFSKLMPILGKEPYFLYNYAAELYVSGYYKEALYIARQCRAYWADYDLELLLGEILRKLKQFQKAEQHFQKASLMCPVRFVPLYRIYELHKEQGDTATMQRLGKQILDKPIKIDSHTIRKIKQNIQKDLSFDI